MREPPRFFVGWMGYMGRDGADRRDRGCGRVWRAAGQQGEGGVDCRGGGEEEEG